MHYNGYKDKNKNKKFPKNIYYKMSVLRRILSFKFREKHKVSNSGLNQFFHLMIKFK